MSGILPRTKPPANSASLTAPATSFANLDAFTSPGRTTIRFAWILTRERKRDSFTSETGAPRVVLQTCKAIPLPSGNLQAEVADGHRPIKPAAGVYRLSRRICGLVI